MGSASSADRRELEQVLGLLVWATQIALSLRALLAPLFQSLRRPSNKLQLLRLDQIQELVDITGPETLVVRWSAVRSDAQAQWQLREVAGSKIDSRGTTAKVKERQGLGAIRGRVAALQVLQTQLGREQILWAAPKLELQGAADVWEVGSGLPAANSDGSMWRLARASCRLIGSCLLFFLRRRLCCK